jgi:multiple sugar transport system permease protein
VKKALERVLLHLLLLSMAVLMVFPLLWLVSTSLKEPSKQMIWPPQLIPSPLHLENFRQLFVVAPMALYLMNSFKITILSVIGTCLSSSLAAFAFARMRFRGKNALFAILIATMMLPYAVTVIPTFTIMRSLGWLDTHYPLIVPAYFGSAFNVFLLRQTYRTIPQEALVFSAFTGRSLFRWAWRPWRPSPSLPFLAPGMISLVRSSI